MTTKASFKIEVVRTSTPGAQYVGRPTPLGNPYYLADERKRDEVCDKYEAWFAERVAANNPRVMNELRRLYREGQRNGVLSLACYCAPLRCHADTIARFLRNYTADSQ